MSEALGKLHFWPSLVFMNGIFMPMFIQGFAGVSRRLWDGGHLYAHAQGVLQWNEFMSISAFCLAAAQIPFILNILMSLFNGKKVNKKKELQEKIRTTIFGPEDLALIKGGPSERRNYLDELLLDLHVKNQLIKVNFEKCLKQRNTLLKQAKGKLTTEIETTLDVWDEKFSESGQQLALERINLLEQLKPEIEKTLNKFTNRQDAVSFEYEQLWEKEKLFETLQTKREIDIRRGTTTTGPHRDEIEIKVNNLLSKTHSSQGEQRSLALGLRFAGHEIVKKTTGSEPIVLLDDVFSELDDTRCRTLIDLLPKKQAVLTTTGELPNGVKADYKYHVVEGTIQSSE